MLEVDSLQFPWQASDPSLTSNPCWKAAAVVHIVAQCWGSGGSAETGGLLELPGRSPFPVFWLLCLTRDSVSENKVESLRC